MRLHKPSLFICSRCKLPKKRQDFYEVKNLKHRGFGHECRQCILESASANNIGKSQRILEKENLLMIGFIKCEKCGEFKEAIEKYFKPKNKGQLGSPCLSCTNKSGKEYKRILRSIPLENEKLKEIKRRYSKTKKGKENKRFHSTSYNHKRRHVENNIPFSWTGKNWRLALEYFNNKCCYCGTDAVKQLTQDHFIPISDKNSPGTVPGNMVPACWDCNMNKRKQNPYDWCKDKSALKKIESYFKFLKYKDE